MNSKIELGIRMLFGLLCIVFGLNKFIGFMPMPPIPGDGGVLMGIYSTSGFFVLIGALEVLGGLALVVNKFVPLALTILVAIMFNAVIFHLLHNIAGIGAAALGMVLSLALVYMHKERFADLLRA